MATTKRSSAASRRHVRSSRQATARRRIKAWTGARRRRSYRSSAATQPQRVARRRRSGTKRSPLRLPRFSVGRLLGVTLAALLLAVLVLLFENDLFYVDEVEIAGATYSAREEIYRHANVHDYSVFWVNEQAVAWQFAAMPFVKSARVRAVLPNKVRIDIVERQPVAIWQANGRDLWVDSEGITLPVASQLSSLPVLVDMDSSTTDAGRVDPRIIAGVVELHQQLPGVGRFAYDKARGLHFTMPDGALVILGENTRLAERVQQLIALQSALAAQGQAANEIDLSHDNGYYMKLVTTQP